MRRKETLKSSIWQSKTAITFAKSIALSAFAGKIALTGNAVFRVGLRECVSAFARLFQRNTYASILVNPNAFGVKGDAGFLSTIAASMIDSTRSAYATFLNLFQVITLVWMSFWTAFLLGIKGTRANAAQVVNDRLYGFDMSRIDTGRHTAQMVAMQLIGYLPNKQRVRHAMQRVMMPVDTDQGIFMQFMKIPKPTRACESGISDGDMRKKFGEKFQGNLNTIIIKGGHLLKHSPLVGGLVYGVCAP